jgi:formylglycine-generating enzyme required for sulfatase activity
VTNAEYMRFVDAGAPPPHFWVDRGGRWFYRGMFREIPLPLEWPVWVTQQEASEYAAWAGKRLPTEAEYQRAAFGASDSLSFTPDPARDNFDFQRWDPVPVNSVGMNPLGIAGMTGNGWEWTSTPFAPFPGFAPFPFYPGYSADFFDGEHYVMKGASPRTAACMARPSFRNWFRASYPYMYAGFRVAES